MGLRVRVAALDQRARRQRREDDRGVRVERRLEYAAVGTEGHLVRG